MVTYSKVRGFVVIGKIRFIKSVDPTPTEVLSDSIRLEKDVVVKAGILDVRFLRELEQASHRGDPHDSVVRFHVSRVPVEVTDEENVIFISVRLLDIPIHICQRPDFSFPRRNVLTPDNMDSDHRKIELTRSEGCPVRIASEVVFAVRSIWIQFTKTTKQALESADRIGKMLAQHGYTTVTGLAKGCDAAAVEGALSAGSKVIGVVPLGLKSLRDPARQLAQKIFATGGAVISEYPDNFAKASNQHYLRRNAIITGLSEKTIIIAADERSGSSATANRALSQGREVLITRYVKAKIEGATLVENLGELKDALGIARVGNF